ncbi:hypothetical protein HD806DRAFT_535757 [Xylariaceae sp. AK1471]|nr:hypothetical protein HD806DRAFT_535757 [Xylariaceae sp. AK1471]
MDDRLVTLLAKTTHPTNIPSSDKRVTDAFRALYEIIMMQKGPTILARFAFVQLQKVFTVVEALIAAERKTATYGRVHNTTIAISRFVEAIGDANTGKGQVMELRRKMKRWSYLAQPSVFFLMTYSDSAKLTVKNFKTTRDAVLPQLVTQIEVATPEAILSACCILDLAVR